MTSYTYILVILATLMALSLSEWIIEVERLGLILKLADFAALPQDEAIALVPLEAAMVVLEEYPERFPCPLPNTVYPAVEFFAPLLRTFTRTHNKKAASPSASIKGILSGVLGSAPGVETVYVSGAHAATGYGDQFTRYILTEDLLRTPSVYINR